jgi:hypothetical protein
MALLAPGFLTVVPLFGAVLAALAPVAPLLGRRDAAEAEGAGEDGANDGCAFHGYCSLSRCLHAARARCRRDEGAHRPCKAS